MSKQIEFIEHMIDIKIEHYERRLKNNLNGINEERVMSILTSCGSNITESSIALEILEQIKVIINQSKNFKD